jgi:hypothetical protein
VKNPLSQNVFKNNSVVHRGIQRNKMTKGISEMGMLAPSHFVWNVLRVFMLCNTLSKYTRKIIIQGGLYRSDRLMSSRHSKRIMLNYQFLAPLSSQSLMNLESYKPSEGDESRSQGCESSFPVEVCFP